MLIVPYLTYILDSKENMMALGIVTFIHELDEKFRIVVTLISTFIEEM